MSQTIAGALVGKALGAFPDNMIPPEWVPIDAAASQGNAIAGNLLNFNQAQKLTSMANMANQTELNRLVEMQLPGGSQIIKDNLIAGMQGKLAPGTLANLKRLAAEKGVGGQGIGSNFNLAGEMSDVVKETEDLILKNMDSASRWIQSSVVPRIGVQSMFIDPMTRLNFDVSERDKKLKWNLMERQIASMPQPGDVALAEGFDNFFKTWSSVGMGAMGSMGGIAGGSGGGGGDLSRSGMNTSDFSSGMF